MWAQWFSAGWPRQKQCIWFLERNIERTFFLRKPLAGKSCFKPSLWISACCPNIVMGMESRIREAYWFCSMLLPNETFTKPPGPDWQIRIPIFKIDVSNSFFAMQMKHSKIVYQKTFTKGLGHPSSHHWCGFPRAETWVSFSFMHWLPHYRLRAVLKAAWSEIPSGTWASCLVFRLNHCTVWGWISNTQHNIFSWKRK